MLRIRLRRMGSRHRPFYRVVVGDSRRTPTASALEEIGYYDPGNKPAALSIDIERADHWMSRGALPSKTVERLLEKARAEPSPEETKAPSAEAEAKAPAEASPEEAGAPAEPSAEAAPEPAAEKEAPSAAAEAEAEAPSAPSAEAEAESEPEAKADPA